MKKSVIYHMAQIAVLGSGLLQSDKLQVLRELMSQEDVALYCEKREAEEAEKDA